MERPSCGTCVYWNELMATIGQCHRVPPIPFASHHRGESHDVTEFPVTGNVCWCGEHPDFPEWIESRKAIVSPAPAHPPASDPQSAD